MNNTRMSHGAINFCFARKQNPHAGHSVLARLVLRNGSECLGRVAPGTGYVPGIVSERQSHHRRCHVPRLLRLAEAVAQTNAVVRN